MTFKTLKEISGPHFYSLSLDRFFPKFLRSVVRKAAVAATLISFLLSFNALPLYFSKADSLFFVFLIVYISFSLVEFFYKSMKGEGLPVRIKESLADRSKTLDYSLSNILYATDEIDVTRAFFENKIGLEILMRSGISPRDSKNFIHDPKRSLVLASSLELPGDFADLREYASALYDSDKSLQNFLSQNSVNKEEFTGAADWIGDMERAKLRKERYWSRENLGTIPSIGTSWSYGASVELGKYGVPFEKMSDLSALDIENGYRKREVALLEGILERRSEANAIIIDDDENASRDIVGRLLKKINLGVSFPSIEHKNIIELDWNALIASYKNKGELESALLKILNQSVLAGNVILYIRDLAGLISSGKTLGVSVSSLLSPYLASRSLQIIASATNADFHFFIETNSALLERFERVIPEKAGVEATISALLEQVPVIERQYPLFFSFPAVRTLSISADRFISYGEMPGKALDLLTEIAPWAVARNISLVRENDVSVFVSEKTGIVTGDIKEKEAQKIENLEEILHKRIIGQNEAVKSIADAMRRSRSGVGNPKKPMSSFLFVGPTGVGKTEVSKALAESFFGDEGKMIRFDMSEYNGPEALSQLIGDFAENRSGLLASKVRDNPYSVLLLDEFEKAAPDVLDLFLQVLDEGIFTDALGRQVVCRNLIIIATSNAKSDLIWEVIRQGKDLLKEKDNIINEIIKEKIFRPELLNRFDGIVLFSPLSKTELRSVARLSLQKLARRLLEKDIELAINDEVLDFLVEKGIDPQFGARSINRAIQNEIENLVAKKIVSGEIKAGDKLEIKKEELE